MADDHTLYRVSLCRMINEWDNCKVILQVSNGKQLLEQIDGGACPQLVLTDLRMPEMNGYETIRALSKKYPEIKVMVVSMFESEEATMQIIKLGAKGCINKCAEPKQLRKAIHELMRSGYYFSDHSAAKIFKQALETDNMNLKNGLTDEEITFLKYIITDMTYKEIAVKMRIHPRHVEYIRSNLFERFGTQSKTGLVTRALEKGLSV